MLLIVQRLPAAHNAIKLLTTISPLSVGAPSTTSCPRSAHNFAASSTAATQSGCTGVPRGAFAVKAIRSFPVSAPTSLRNGLAGGGATYGSPGAIPDVASSMAALSRTLQLTTCSATKPLNISPKSGPRGLRARVGFKPKIPQHEAGMRIEPPPSFACATGTTLAATAAAEPPDEPPVVRVVSQGLWDAP